MKNSDYIQSYLNQSKIEINYPSNPTWLKKFFQTFHDELKYRNSKASPGNRYSVTKSLSISLDHIIPEKTILKREIQLKDLLSFSDDNELEKMLKRKRIDFLIETQKSLLLIEFKTNLQFNDVAAAMIEMGIVKKYKKRINKKNIITGSLHLFPFKSNIVGIKEMNSLFETPLDNIWIFCKGPELSFDTKAIMNFRNMIKKI